MGGFLLKVYLVRCGDTDNIADAVTYSLFHAASILFFYMSHHRTKEYEIECWENEEILYHFSWSNSISRKEIIEDIMCCENIDGVDIKETNEGYSF